MYCTPLYGYCTILCRTWARRPWMADGRPPKGIRGGRRRPGSPSDEPTRSESISGHASSNPAAAELVSLASRPLYRLWCWSWSCPRRIARHLRAAWLRDGFVVRRWGRDLKRTLPTTRERCAHKRMRIVDNRSWFSPLVSSSTSAIYPPSPTYQERTMVEISRTACCCIRDHCGLAAVSGAVGPWGSRGSLVCIPG